MSSQNDLPLPGERPWEKRPVDWRTPNPLPKIEAPPGLPVGLEEEELVAGVMIGAMRAVRGIVHKRRLTYGSEEEKVWPSNIEGALGEMAFANFLGRYWGGAPILGQTDVGIYEVKTRLQHWHALILHPDSPDRARFVLITGMRGQYLVRGWCYGAEAKREKFWDDPVLRSTKGKKGRPAYFVPAGYLRPIPEKWKLADVDDE